jgi:outer membrane protein assembly factor BamB
MRRLLASLALIVLDQSSWATPPDATAYQITVAHSGATTSGGVVALQLTPLWSVTLQGATQPSTYPLIAGSNVYVVAGDLLYAFNAKTGAAVWGPTQVSGALAATYDAGNVFVVSAGGLLSSFNATNGTPGWAVQLQGQYSFTSPPTASNGIIYVAGSGDSGTLYAVKEADGSILWSGGVINGDDSSPTIGPNSGFVSYACLITSSFNLTTGANIWSNPATCEGGGGDTAVYASGKLYARDPVSGNDIFDATNGAILGSFASATPPAVDASTAYYLNDAGVLSAVDVTSSAVRWTFTGDGGLTSSPLVVDQTAIIGSSSGNLYGLDESSGNLTWLVNAGQGIQSGTIGTSGLAIAEGILVVPVGTQLVAYSIFGPPAPTAATAASAVGAAQLTWTGAAGATSYNIYVGTSPGAEALTPVVTGVTGTSALVPNLAPGTGYYLTVKTVGAAGISAPSNEVTAIPSVATPPSALKATSGVASAQLSWVAATTGGTYNVYEGLSAGAESAVPVLSGVTSTGTTVAGLLPAATYYFTVKAVVNGATSAASNEVSATPLVSAAPTSVAATPIIGGATLSWVASPGATSYQLYVGTLSGGESSTPSQSGITGTTVEITNLTAGTTYYAVVRSVVSGVSGPPSQEVSFTPQADGAPTDLSLTPGVGAITLSWTASPGALTYSVYEGTASGQEASTPVLTIAALQGVVTGLSSGTTYYFYVQGNTAIGPSQASTEVSGSPNAPPGPTNLAATASTNGITLTWSAAADATTYAVFEGTTAGGESATPVQSGITGLSTVVTGLTAGTTYYYVVRAATTEGTSAASNEASATTAAAMKSSGGGALNAWSLIALGGLVWLRRHAPNRNRAGWDDIRVGDSVVIPKGTAAVGEVVDSKKAGILGKAGVLVLSARYVQLDQRDIRLRSALGAAGDARMEPAFFVPFVRGAEAIVDQGTRVTVRTASDER